MHENTDTRKEQVLAKGQTYIRGNTWCKKHSYPQMELSCQECISQMREVHRQEHGLDNLVQKTV